MKILYVAFACNPYAGSEAQCGWAWPLSMRAYAQVYVLTRNENRQHIERYLAENKINDITVFYHDVPDMLNLYRRTGKYYHAYYLLWLSTSNARVRALRKQYGFQYVHQVTLGDFRAIGRYAGPNTQFIFGPVGGAQYTPSALEAYARQDAHGERVRRWINRFTACNPRYRNALNRAAVVLAANRETQAYLQRCMRQPERCHLLTENGVLSERLGYFPIRMEREPVKIMWAGRMVNRKGLKFLLDVLAKMEPQKRFILYLAGDGPQRGELEKRAMELHLDERVVFLGKVPYEQMHSLYRQSDLFVFPSLRETTGTVLFEAMAAGLPIVTFEQNGADILVDAQSGRKINVCQPLPLIQKAFADALTALIENAGLRQQLGRAAYDRILKDYLWENKCRQFVKQFLGTKPVA